MYRNGEKVVVMSDSNNQMDLVVESYDEATDTYELVGLFGERMYAESSRIIGRKVEVIFANQWYRQILVVANADAETTSGTPAMEKSQTGLPGSLSIKRRRS